ncbi:hypothetical protein CDAR_398821 [Caerostris darwini]|uniref:Uncharacterized protein n=1 Tax=Caerostris darwini TaxID=1538125 RepID=A0AAV4V7R8_9ARAC|nr:hypothetical protein CDAR_398821 [Caerostris darwini]
MLNTIPAYSAIAITISSNSTLVTTLPTYSYNGHCFSKIFYCGLYNCDIFHCVKIPFLFYNDHYNSIEFHNDDYLPNIFYNGHYNITYSGLYKLDIFYSNLYDYDVFYNGHYNSGKFHNDQYIYNIFYNDEN